ncbi:MAG: glycogen/starch/alpha-glucan phosphorylase [Bacilli bacterium]
MFDTFKTKEKFEEAFKNRLIEKYGLTVKESHISERYDVLGELVRDYAGINWRHTRSSIVQSEKKQLIYFSMEFLMGRLLVNNMQNLGIYEVCKNGLADLDIDINELEDEESDEGLGNGGLGRLAACFLDSIASLGYPGHGNCLRYEYGFFRQKFVDGKQTELPDQWLTNGNVWEVRKPKHAVEVQFYGRPETYIRPDGSFAVRLVDSLSVQAMPYDISVVGYHNKLANTLRLWSSEPSSNNLPTNMSFEDYLSEIKMICHSLYPDDSNEAGKLLRLKQEYFLVSSGLQSAIRSYYGVHGNLEGFAEKYVFQLNDTHPILAIPEMMRIMMDGYGCGWDFAWEQVTKSIAYTNHTILAEALEKWPTFQLQRLLPRIYMIIEEINRRFNIFLSEKKVDDNSKRDMAIIKDGQVYMANMAIYAGFSINGVAAIHTRILETTTFSSFYKIFPRKFNNKTNGITHRRWFLYSNPKLSSFVTDKIGDEWILNSEKLVDFDKFADNAVVQNRVLRIKHENKRNFAEFVKNTYGIEIDPSSIFDVQVKRLHAYKRQLMNILHIMYLYNKIKENPNFEMIPTTFIFGAKAAPSYLFAKKVIELINSVASYVNNDPEVSKFIKIVFVENYGVSLAEKIIPAADVSEQISTAGYEASGTSNMKFMMNGAITLGTMDGANIEIVEKAGKENAIIFGLTAKEVETYENTGTYNPWDLYNTDPVINKVVNSLFNGPWAQDNQERFKIIFDELMSRNDQFFLLKDFHGYVEAHEKVQALYANKSAWAKACIHNIANSGYFSSDRTIEQYVKDIWHLEKLEAKDV